MTAVGYARLGVLAILGQGFALRGRASTTQDRGTIVVTQTRDEDERGVGAEAVKQPVGAGAVPARRGVWAAVAARPFLVIATTLVFVLAGALYGVARTPKYSATTKLAVLHVNFGAPGALAGFSTATAALADTYARAITANGVIKPLAARFHQSEQQITGELGAAAVPQTPIFTVTATTSSHARSIALVNAADQQLLAYFQAVNSQANRSTVYQALSTAEGQLAAAQVAQQSILAGIKREQLHAGVSTMTPQQQSALSGVQGRVYALQDRVGNLKKAYANSSSSPQFAQQLTSASTAHSDRMSKLALSTFIGLIVGIGLSVGLALLVDAGHVVVPRRMSVPRRSPVPDR
ncbi:MAG TPA: Wzz/FepE/Etk N-terminal domain-containing protein [Solirubrobacteraceae bacterium]|jgi:capsular polysaccharide biosynthesis protein|nr:Wzz/FepE/Etk N-terminal domain-containing protein [Solirubrobacteraceae bacterium]